MKGFGKFEIVEKIAQGGMAEIYKARMWTDGGLKTVAIKKILPQYVKNEEFVTLLTDEAKLMVTLNHPNIVPLIEYGTVEKDYYLALEYIHGKTFKDLMKKAYELNIFIPFEVCAFVVKEICEGLDYAHRKRDNGKPLNIIHRDISPTNVLISYFGQVKLVDFGISKAASHTHVTQTGVIRGKMGYMSPEQTRSYLDIDARSDIYSAGILLYEIVTGKRLFPADTISDAIKLVRRGDVPKPAAFRPGLPKILEKVIISALDPSVERRLPSAAIMRDMLNEYLAGSSIKKNYSRIFSSADLGHYVQHLFSDGFEEEKDEIGFFDIAKGIGTPKPLGVLAPFKESANSRIIYSNVEYKGGRTETSSMEDSLSTKEIRERYGLRKRITRRFKRVSKVYLYIASLSLLALSLLVGSSLRKDALNTGQGVKSIDLLTKPAGAKAYVNGDFVGETPITDVKVQGLSVVRVDKRGFKPAQVAFVAQDREEKLEFRLEEETEKGELTVFSFPIGAKLYLNGIARCSTPCRLDDLKVGSSQRLVLKLEGYKEMQTQITIDEKGKRFLSFDLSR